MQNSENKFNALQVTEEGFIALSTLSDDSLLTARIIGEFDKDEVKISSYQSLSRVLEFLEINKDSIITHEVNLVSNGLPKFEVTIHYKSGSNIFEFERLDLLEGIDERQEKIQ